MEIDLTNCDKEAIHIGGHIQPFGFLLIVDKKTSIIEQVSENTTKFLGLGAGELLGKPLAALFRDAPDTAAKLRSAGWNNGPHFLNLKGQPFFVFAHESAVKLILECEPFTPQSAEASIGAGNLLNRLQARLNQLCSVDEISASVAEAVQKVLDYDRVVVFKFDPDWHAEVVGEKVKPGIHSFEGHHFPASDIPAPARELLLVKHIRHIPEVSAPPVAILPYLNPSTGTPTDILKSEFRYPSKIHLEFLANMEVASSLSFSVIIQGKLWGSISGSNKKPKYINFWKRQLGDQIAKAFANIILSSQEKRDFQEFSQYKKREEALLSRMIAGGNKVSERLLNNDINLLSMSRAAGVAVCLDNNIMCYGLCPEVKDIQDLLNWLSLNNSEAVFNTRKLSAMVEGAENYRAIASGLLALEVSRFNKEYILYFKPEIEEKRIWAGNPEKSMVGEDLRIHPRKSFEKWEEEIKGKSQPWTMNEVEIARILLKDVVAVRVRNQARRLEELKEEYQMTAEGLEIKNRQLEDFARIITHNLRSPLGNMLALYNLYKAGPQKHDVNLFLEKIKEASQNMLVTIDDLNLILRKRVGDHLQQEKVNIRESVDKELQSLEALLINEKADIIIELFAPEININKVYFESIMHNLLSNALKYTSPGRQPRIVVKSWLEENNFYLSVSDNGLGIDLTKYGDKIFGLYKTFHKHSNARGIGLYITKMQVEAMGGNIEVQSQPGKGSLFTVRFNYPFSF